MQALDFFPFLCHIIYLQGALNIQVYNKNNHNLL